MTSRYAGRLGAAGFVILLCAGCWVAVPGGAGGSSGTGGRGGMGGTGGVEPDVLWERQGNGADVCFNVAGDGERLTPSPGCDLASRSEANAYQIRAELIGSDDNGDGCSFEFGFTGDVPIDPVTHGFRVSGFQPPGSDAKLSFSGGIDGIRATGVARLETDGAFCEVGWAAQMVTRCDDDARETCLALLECCSAILINPIFFQSCNAVVQQCDRLACQRLLDGYPQCAPPPPPDAGAEDAG